ncbi:MAG: hypothetical protein GY716_14980, partial [bacterium]|nr:hypothetical protein [bacterium]
MRIRICAGLCALLLASVVEPQVVRQITQSGYRTPYLSGVAIDDAGTVLVATSAVDRFGSNPDETRQILSWQLPGGAGSQVGQFERGVGPTISITDDGVWIAVTSRSDPAGQNPDGS